MRYAIVVDGLVVNVILWDGESEYPEELVPCPEEASIGWSFLDGEWSAPEPEIVELPTEALTPEQHAAIADIMDTLGLLEATARTMLGLPAAPTNE